MVKGLARSYLINLFALWVAAQYIGGFHLTEGWKSLLIVGAGFTTLHLILKPVLKIFLGALNFLTLGVIDLIIDAGILYALALYFPQVSLTPWYFPGLITDYLALPAYDLSLIAVTVISAFLINVIRSVLEALAS
ncbi:phage holin family protein [Patescibacteria group bacterium]|nr:phage holin family protein [Patescibacteria group bacterium]